MLAERNRTSPRAAFESLRREARSSGRPVAELAREVLAGLERTSDAGGRAPSRARARPAEAAAGAPVPRPLQAVAAADGRP